MSDAEKESAAMDNRARFPFVAAKLEELRSVFGQDAVTVWYAEENGQRAGKTSYERGYRSLHIANLGKKIPLEELLDIDHEVKESR